MMMIMMATEWKERDLDESTAAHQNTTIISGRFFDN
jgi:hypothetical protein